MEWTDMQLNERASEGSSSSRGRGGKPDHLSVPHYLGIVTWRLASHHEDQDPRQWSLRPLKSVAVFMSHYQPNTISSPTWMLLNKYSSHLVGYRTSLLHIYRVESRHGCCCPPTYKQMYVATMKIEIIRRVVCPFCGPDCLGAPP